jgi:hypothetical protein
LPYLGDMDSTQHTEYKTYTVTLRFQFPAWDEREGIPFEVTARTKADAIKQARRQADYGGHLCGGHGRVSFKAVENIEA